MPYLRFLNGDLAEIPDHIRTDSELYNFVRENFPSPRQSSSEGGIVSLRLTLLRNGKSLSLFTYQPMNLQDDDIVLVHYTIEEIPKFIFKRISFKPKKSATKKRKSIGKKRKSISKKKKSPTIKSPRGCTRQTTAKYINRPSPPYPANECCGETFQGNDGQMYESRVDKKGVCKWVKI